MIGLSLSLTLPPRAPRGEENVGVLKYLDVATQASRIIRADFLRVWGITTCFVLSRYERFRSGFCLVLRAVIATHRRR